MARFRKALELDPDDVPAHMNLGNALAACKRVGEAKRTISAVLEIDPGNAVLHNNLAIALARQGHFGEALTHYREARIKRDYAEAHYNCGSTLASFGRLDDAIAHYRAAIELRPGFTAARNSLQKALADRGELGDPRMPASATSPTKP